MNNKSGRLSRQRGVRFERIIARKLSRWWPRAKRGLQYQFDEHCPDIVGTPFYIECKYTTRRYFARSLEKIYEKAAQESIAWSGHKDARPVLVIRRRARRPIQVSMKKSTAMALGLPTVIGDNCLCTYAWPLVAAQFDVKYKKE